MNIKVVIPARYGSSRLPGKPLLKINGVEVVNHVVQRCIEAGVSHSDICVASDDGRVLDVIDNTKSMVIMTDSRHQSGTDRLCEVAEKEGWSDDTLVINVQGDEPMIPPDLISNLLSFASSNPQFHICTAVTSITSLDEFNNPNVVKAIMGEGGRALYFTRSASPFNRDVPGDIEMANRHIGIYSYRVSALKRFCSYEESQLEKYEKLEQLRALSHGMTIGAFVYEGNIPHGVDTMEDFDKVRELMELEK